MKQPCTHLNQYRMLLRFDEPLREEMKKSGHWAPYTHQVVWCPECAQVVGQEDNSERKALSFDIQQAARRS